MILRLAAVLLLAVTAIDVTVEGACEPLVLRNGTERLTTAGAQRDDAVTSVCPPDCFCCSRKVVALSAILPAAPDSVKITPITVGTVRQDGVQRVPYRPPLSAA